MYMNQGSDSPYHNNERRIVNHQEERDSSNDDRSSQMDRDRRSHKKRSDDEDLQKKKSRSRSNDDIGHQKQHKQKSRSRSDGKQKKHKKRNHKRDSSPDSDRREERKDVIQNKELYDKLAQTQKEAEEAQRQDLTIIVYSLPPAAKEKDVYSFFLKENTGKIRDIRIIQDQRSGKSKGVAYVEFFTSESVQKALTLHQKIFILEGRNLPACPIVIQHSQAEKNRAALAAKNIQIQKQQIIEKQMNDLSNGPMRIMVSELTHQLGNITQEDLFRLFSPIGQITLVEINRDSQTNASLGTAIIEYQNSCDAQVAIDSMNNFEIKNQIIQVTGPIPLPIMIPGLQMGGGMGGLGVGAINPNNMGMGSSLTIPGLVAPTQPYNINYVNNHNNNAYGVPNNQYNTNPNGVGGNIDGPDLDDNDAAAFLHNPQSRLMLMQKLNRDDFQIKQPTNQMQSDPGMVNLGVPQSQTLTQCVVLGNMFIEQDLLNSKTFIADLREEVQDEAKKCGPVENVIVDKSSQTGNVFVMFKEIKGAMNCIQMMNDRFYMNRKLTSYHIPDQYLSKFF